MSLPLSLLRPAAGDLLSLLPAADNFSLDFDVSVNVQHIHEGQQTGQLFCEFSNCSPPFPITYLLL